MQHVDAGHHFEQLSGELKRRTIDAGHVYFARIGLRISDELRDRRGRNRRIDFHYVRHPNDARDRCDIPQEYEVEIRIKCSADRVRGIDQEQRIPVWLCPYDRFSPDVAAGAGPILDDELLIKPLGQVLPDQARNDVGRAAWRKADDNPHRPGRIGLCASEAGQGRQRQSASGPRQALSTGDRPNFVRHSRPFSVLAPILQSGMEDARACAHQSYRYRDHAITGTANLV